MPFERIDFETLSETNLRDLVVAGTPEGRTIEFKRDNYGRSDADVREFLKDVSSFANTEGGHLIIGLNESNGCAHEICAITDETSDQALQRLESLIRDGIEPRIYGVRIKAIPIASGGFVAVVRVPRSWYPPHRVSARGSNRFFARNSSGVHEASVEELRMLFSFSATASDRMKQFRRERLSLIDSGETPVPLADDHGRLVLHIIPLSAFSMRHQVDLTRAAALDGALRPIAAMGHSPRYNYEGFLTFRPGEPSYGYTQLFRDGSLEAVKVRVTMEREGRLVIPSLDFGQHIIEALPGYMRALQSLEIPPPLSVILTVQGVRGAVLGVSSDQFLFTDPAPIVRDSLFLTEVLIEDYGPSEHYLRALRPAFDALWNAGGFPASEHYNADGDWVGARRR